MSELPTHPTLILPAYSDGESELLVLSYAMRDLQTLQEVIDIVDTDYFANFNHRALWVALKDYFSRYNGMMDEVGLERLMDESGADAAKKTNYHALLYMLKSRETVKPQFLISLDHLRLLRKKRELFDVANKISAALRTPNPDVDKLTVDTANQVLNMSVRTGTTVFYEQSLKATLPDRINEYIDRESHPEKFVGIPFGIKELDELTSGMFPEELVLIFGRSGVGKSRTLASVGYNVFARGFNVMYVTIEMPMTQVGRLFDSRHFLVSSHGLRHGKLEKEDRMKYVAGDAGITGRDGDFYVVDAPAGCSTLTLLPLIRRYKSQKKLDLIIVDYMNLMVPVEKTNGNEILKLGAISKELKQLARSEKVAIFTATAASRATTQVKEVSNIGTEHLSWSDNIAYNCDVILFIRKKEEADVENKNDVESWDIARKRAINLDCMVVKYRDGGNRPLKIGANWDNTFVGDLEEYLEMTGRILPGMVPIINESTVGGM